jgi:hypothetical protein
VTTANTYDEARSGFYNRDIAGRLAQQTWVGIDQTGGGAYDRLQSLTYFPGGQLKTRSVPAGFNAGAQASNSLSYGYDPGSYGPSAFNPLKELNTVCTRTAMT